MNKPLVIYHANCMDGFAAACVVARYLHGQHVEADFHAAQYGEPAPDVTDRRVYVVDFSYSLKTMARLITDGLDLTFIDHHETSREIARFLVSAHRGSQRVTVEHSDEACGATMAWAHFFGGVPMPDVLCYVEDRDLWRWELSNSRAVSAGLRSTWALHWGAPGDVWMSFFGSDVVGRAGVIGEALLADQAVRVADAVKRAESCVLDGFTALATNAAVDQSEIGDALGELASVAVVYWKDPTIDDGKPWVHSLRSRSGVDVSAIAKARGGGGHKAAAGFRSEFNLMETWEG